MARVDIARLQEIAEVEFADIVSDAFIVDINTLRVLLTDGSFIDVWFSLKLSSRYSFHWERQALDGTLYRHDNAPHRRWQSVSTFPRHFHDGSEGKVAESHLSENPENAMREFLAFVREKMSSTSEHQN